MIRITRSEIRREQGEFIRGEVPMGYCRPTGIYTAELRLVMDEEGYATLMRVLEQEFGAPPGPSRARALSETTLLLPTGPIEGVLEEDE